MWKDVKITYMKTENEMLGYANKNRKEWLSNNTWKLVEEKKHVKTQLMNRNKETTDGVPQEQYRIKDKELKTDRYTDRRADRIFIY